MPQGKLMSAKAQSSFEALLLLSLIFVGILFIFSVFFQVKNSTTAMELAKIAAVEKISALPGFHYIERIDFVESPTQTGMEITLTIKILPVGHGLTSESFSEEQEFIRQQTKYETVTINPA